jgi:RNA polymerase sigma-70 factor (ECF subfamily)
MSEQTDEQLVSAYLTGDKSALEVLVSRHLKPIYGYLLKHLGRVPDAEDLTQEVFVKAWRHLKKFDQTKNFTSWLFRIAQNTLIDFFRKKKQPLAVDLDLDWSDEHLPDEALGVGELLDRGFLATKLNTLVDRLSGKYRKIIELRYREELSLVEIAAELDEPLDTVKSRHRRALIYLRKFFTK